MATTNQIVRIEPSILTWARESLGLSLADVAAKLKKDKEEIRAWEYGEAFPTFAQLEKLAYLVYKRPLAAFFLPKPPAESTPKQDFRTLPEQEIETLSPSLRLIIRKAKFHQLVLKEANDGKNFLEHPMHKAIRFTGNDLSDMAASKVRAYLKIDRAVQKSQKSPDHAFGFYRNLVENHGIFVFQYPLEGVRGFSLMDSEFPVIVLNSGDTPSGKNFTLFHELCHILFNVGGVFRDTATQELKLENNAIEIFCNRFSSELLLPARDLLAELSAVGQTGEPHWKDSVLYEIAMAFNVSREVVLRKLLDLGRTNREFYLEARRRWAEDYARFKETKKDKEQGGGPSYHVTNMSHLGKNFVSRILTTYHEGKISATQVADVLGVKMSRIREYEQRAFS